jgi:hypothetical protein
MAKFGLNIRLVSAMHKKCKYRERRWELQQYYRECGFTDRSYTLIGSTLFGVCNWSPNTVHDDIEIYNPPSYQIGHTTRKIEEPVKQKSKQDNIHSTPTGLQLS